MTETKKMPPPAGGQPAPRGVGSPIERFAVSKGRQVGAQRVLVYGPGGVGKTELAAQIPDALFLDLEGGTDHLDVARLDGVKTYQDVRDAIAFVAASAKKPPAFVVDTATRVEELSVEHVITTVPHDKPGTRITGIESYGFGKGYRHVYDAFGLVLHDLDNLVRSSGISVVVLAHSCTNEAPNPTGDNWLRYEPRMQHPRKENSIRERVIGWADHVLFVGFDVAVDRDGKGRGAGTRTIYTREMPSHIAKTRGTTTGATMPASILYPRGDGTIWSMILGGAA